MTFYCFGWNGTSRAAVETLATVAVVTREVVLRQPILLERHVVTHFISNNVCIVLQFSKKLIYLSPFNIVPPYGKAASFYRLHKTSVVFRWKGLVSWLVKISSCVNYRENVLRVQHMYQVQSLSMVRCYIFWDYIYIVLYVCLCYQHIYNSSLSGVNILFDLSTCYPLIAPLATCRTKEHDHLRVV